MKQNIKKTMKNSPFNFDTYRKIRIFLESFFSRKYLISSKWKIKFGTELNLENPKNL